MRAKGTLVRQAVGTLDDTRELNRRFHDRMTELKIAHEYAEVPGAGHDTRAAWQPLAEGYKAFYREPTTSGFLRRL